MAKAVEFKDFVRTKSEQFDIAIIGAGAAGISLAVTLAGSCRRVVLVESGGFEFEDRIQDLYRGSVVDGTKHRPLHQYRQRVFGGTTTVWGGRCSPFDPIDFERRDYLDHSGWPISYEIIRPYYERAHDILDLGRYEYNAAAALGGSFDELIPGFESGSVLQDRIWRFSKPTDLGRKYRKLLESTDNVLVLTNATCTHVQLDIEGRMVMSVRLSDVDGRQTELAARQFVLAAGGLETIRLLLCSDDVHPNGIGNYSGLLGRFYSSHLTGDLGTMRLDDPKLAVKWRYEKLPDGIYYKQQLRISEQMQRERGLLNMRCILTHPQFGNASHRSGVLSGAYLLKRFFTDQIAPEYSNDLASRELQHAFAHIRNVVVDAPNLVGFSFDWLRRRILAERKLPSIALKSQNGEYTLHFDAEQSPCYASKISLGEKRDALGMRRLEVDWRFNPEDVDRLVSNCEVIHRELGAHGIGSITVERDVLARKLEESMGVGSHHLGAARMSDSPRSGVVDRDCRVHCLSNLYLASPCVFPTGSFANPALTIVALALRIGDRLMSLSYTE